MREITKMLKLPVGDESMNFRISKLDAFSGGRLLKLLSVSQEKTEKALPLSDFLFELPDGDFERVMRTCLAHAEVELPAGFIPVYQNDCWGMPEMEYETVTCLRLTVEVMAWSLEGFFPGNGRSSQLEGTPSSR